MGTKMFDEAELAQSARFAPGNPGELALEIARRHGVRLEDMLGRHRAHPLVLARYELCCVLREWGWSYPMIGRFICRDHTTVLAALRDPPAGASRPPPVAKRNLGGRLPSVELDERGNLIPRRS